MSQGVVFPDPLLLVVDTPLFKDSVIGREVVMFVVPVTSSYTSTWGMLQCNNTGAAGGEESTEEESCLLVIQRGEGETTVTEAASEHEQLFTGVVVSERAV